MEKTASVNILVIEDESDIRTMLVYNLRKDGYAALGAADGETGLRMFREKKPQLVILDLMLPGMDGVAVCRRIRAEAGDGGGHTPVLMLTARSGEEDMMEGFEAGADDYVAKPFSNRVLLARVRSLLRRSGIFREVSEETDGLTVGGIALFPERREVFVEGAKVELTYGEYETLKAMMRRPGVVFTRNRLLDLVRGALHAVTDRAIDSQIVGLRRKLGPAGKNVETVRGAGYRIVP
ncbi:MAG: response regulator transcription factor [Planctomycetota bacterium]|jgi:two-component system phosphate regulon response regulator PhoB|nr:response regulator transcription factor [Planctomycetota bacterium]